MALTYGRHARLRFRRVQHSRHSDDSRVWLFDLDNTLHNASHAIFGAINNAMTKSVASHLNIALPDADALRLAYWKRYGATVIGMVRHHGINANTFLQDSHDFKVAELVRAERGLVRKLQQLPGRKILLTNAPGNYAYQVLLTLKLLPQFESIFSMDDMDLQGRLRPKPSLALMQQVLAQLKLPADQVVLVEDTLKNLKSARQAGLRTVHIYHPDTPFGSLHRGRNSYIDLRYTNVNDLLVRRHALRKPNKQDHA